MKRKIIKQGHNTLTVTLPNDWVKRMNISAGTELDVCEKDGGLFLMTEKQDKNSSVEIDITGLDIPTIWKYFMAIYREGYNEIRVKFDPEMKIGSPFKFFSQHKLDMKYGKKGETRTPLEFLHELANRFIGLEVIEHGKDYVLMREISESTGKEFDNSLRRVFLLIQQMAEETLEALKTGNPKLLSHIHDVDINLDKFQDYCIRILNKSANKDSKKTSLYFSVLIFLELLGDEFKGISHHLLYDFKDADYRNIVGFAESIKEQLDLLYELFYKFDKEKLIKISAIDQGRYFNIITLYKKVKAEEEKEIFHHLRVMARLINSLLELRIELEY